jgi:hypothetical protein
LGSLGRHRLVSASCQPPSFGFRCINFASWPLCAFALIQPLIISSPLDYRAACVKSNSFPDFQNRAPC